MFNRILFLWVLLLSLFYTSCREDFDFPNASGPLRFSETQISLDTVFVDSKSSTFVLKVYNMEPNSIVIPNISLKEGGNSIFRINIDGKTETIFRDVVIREKDSLYVFVEIDANSLTQDMSIQDDIFFDTNTSRQTISLNAFVQDVVYLYPLPNEDEIVINTDETWAGKPRVITNNLRITNLAKLTIEQGVSLYFLSGKKLIVNKQASLEVNGSAANPTIFRGHRQEPRYDSIGGQWAGIQLDTLATANLKYTHIQSANIGLYALEGNNIVLNSVKVVNNSRFGLLLFNSTLEASNLITNQCGEAAVAIFMGGDYDFVHSTISNTNIRGRESKVPLFVSDVSQSSSEKGQLRSLNISNSIVYGDADNSVYFFFNSVFPYSYLFKNNLLKNEDTNTFDYTADPRFQNSIYNQNPMFTNPSASANNLKLRVGSIAIDAANVSLVGSATIDFFGNSRLVNPDLGAIESN